MNPRAQRVLLADAAAEYTAHGWPVAPGAWWSPQLRHYACGRAACPVTGPHPVNMFAGPARGTDADRCQVPATACVARPEQIARWWGRRQYGLLLPTHAIGVIEGPADLVDVLDGWLRAQDHVAPLGPAPTSPFGRKELFCGPLQVDQKTWLTAATARALIHGPQSWVTLPPSVTRSGADRWLRSPAECSWTLPPAGVVVDGLRWALSALPPRAEVHAAATGAVML